MTFKNNPQTNNKINQEMDYFVAVPGMEAQRVASAEITQKIHDEYSNVFTGNQCSKYWHHGGR